MYISLQERFYLIFGGVAFFMYLLAKKKGSVIAVLLSTLFLSLLMLAKETGISILMSFLIFTILDILFLSKEKVVNGSFLIASTIFGIPYIMFMFNKVIGGSYPGTGNYHLRGSIGELLKKVAAIPLVCWLILSFSILSIVYAVYKKYSHQAGLPRDYLWILFPLSLMTYIGILIPWGFPTYMLSPVALFLFPTLYLFVYPLSPKLKKTFYSFMVPLSLFVVIFNVIPSVSVMADQRKLAEFVDENLDHHNAYIVTPAVLEEVSVKLTENIGVRTEDYGENRAESSQLDPLKANYLLMNHDCGPFELRGLTIGAEVYRNATWSLHQIVFEENRINIIEPKFSLSFFRKVKKMIRAI